MKTRHGNQLDVVTAISWGKYSTFTALPSLSLTFFLSFSIYQILNASQLKYKKNKQDEKNKRRKNETRISNTIEIEKKNQNN